jgi:CheY-like chemotaxis protein
MKKLILFVTGNPSVWTTLIPTLEQTNYAVVLASDREESLLSFDLSPFSLLILDLSPPVQSKWQKILSSAGTPPSLPILVLASGISDGEADFMTETYIYEHHQHAVAGVQSAIIEMLAEPVKNQIRCLGSSALGKLALVSDSLLFNEHLKDQASSPFHFSIPLYHYNPEMEKTCKSTKGISPV